jgi:hypothetical protein
MVGFITNLECADSGGALDLLRKAEPKRRRATLAAALHKTKRANRKAYDWPLNLEKLLRRKTSGALVVALHQVA